MSSAPDDYIFESHVLDHRTVAELQNKIVKQGGRGTITRFFYARNDKEMIVAWKYDLNRILRVFNVRLVSSYLVLAY